MHDSPSVWKGHGPSVTVCYVSCYAFCCAFCGVFCSAFCHVSTVGDTPPDMFCRGHASGHVLSGTRLRTQNRSAPPAQPTHSINNLIAFCTIEAGNLKAGSGYSPERRIGNHALSLDIPSHTLAPTAAEETTNPPATVHHSDDELNCEEQHKHN